MKNPPATRLFALILAFCAGVVVSGCTGDPERIHVTHFHNPTWTLDGKHVVAGYQDFSSEDGDAGIPGPVQNMYVRDIVTGNARAFGLHGFYETDRFFLDPVNNIAVATSGGLLFVSLDGTTLGTLGGAQFPVVPSLISFTPAGGAFFWAGSASGGSGRVVLGRAQYGASPWLPGSVQIMKDTVIASTLLDIKHTSETTCAMRLSDGTVREYSSSGALLAQFATRPIAQQPPSIWQTRMHLVESGNTRKLYVVEDSGLMTLNLIDKTQKLFVKGRVPNFDVSNAAEAPFMVFETQTGDTWLSTRDGNPLSRLAPQNIMPSLSSNGKWVTSVARLNRYTDTLNVFQLSN